MVKKFNFLLEKQNKDKNILLKPEFEEASFSSWQKKVALHIRRRVRAGYDFLASVKA